MEGEGDRQKVREKERDTDRETKKDRQMETERQKQRQRHRETQRVSKLVFYAQSTSAVISGQWDTERDRDYTKTGIRERDRQTETETERKKRKRKKITNANVLDPLNRPKCQGFSASRPKPPLSNHLLDSQSYSSELSIRNLLWFNQLGRVEGATRG